MQSFTAYTFAPCTRVLDLLEQRKQAREQQALAPTRTAASCVTIFTDTMAAAVPHEPQASVG